LKQKEIDPNPHWKSAKFYKFTSKHCYKTVSSLGERVRICLILAVVAVSCGKMHPPGQRAQGVITYKVTYLRNDLKNISTSLLPKAMIQKYRNHMSLNSIEGFFGTFTLSNISNNKKRTNTTQLKVMGKGYSYTGESGDYGCCFDPFNGMIISFAEGKKTIAGCECSLALATFPGVNQDTFLIWYTQDLGIEKPNINNPFSQIDGVLLEFNLHLKSLKLRLEADKIEHPNIPWSDFDTPPEYKPCSRQKMEEILNALLE
jgi:hypothetical protein